MLGSNDVTAMDMAAAYSTFANRGIKVPPVLVTRITRADGTVLYTQQHQQTKVLEAGVVDTLTSILEQVIERGTGTRAKLDRPAAGKTGTTDDNSDAWFAGYTPQLATAVWVGFPSLGANGKLIPMRPPNTPITVDGRVLPGGDLAAVHERRAGGPARRRRSSLPRPPRPLEALRRAAPGRRARARRRPVPDVVGLTVEEATAILERAGFRVRHGARAPRAPSRPGVGEGAVPRRRVHARLAGSTVILEVTEGKASRPDDG